MSFLSRNWLWISILCSLILLLSLFSPAVSFFWGINSVESLFHNKLGLGESYSKSLSVVFMFIYASLLPIAFAWLIFGRRSSSSILLAFVSVFFVFGSKPLIIGAFGGKFDSNGFAQKCYFWQGNTPVLIERSEAGCGIDTDSGSQSYPITPEIAAIINRQRHTPKPILATDAPIQFFDPSSGRPTVWYDYSHGGYELFDSDGYNPRNGRKLQPVTASRVEAIEEWLQSIKPKEKIADTQMTSLSTVLVGKSESVPPMAVDGQPADCIFRVERSVCHVHPGGTRAIEAVDTPVPLNYCSTVFNETKDGVLDPLWSRISIVTRGGDDLVWPADGSRAQNVIGYIFYPTRLVDIEIWMASKCR